MFKLSPIIFLALLIQSVLTDAQGYEYVVHESRHVASSGWRKTAKAEPSSFMSVRIGLAQQNLVHGPTQLLAV